MKENSIQIVMPQGHNIITKRKTDSYTIRPIHAAKLGGGEEEEGGRSVYKDGM